MSARVTFGVDAANALRSLGRDVLDRRGRVAWNKIHGTLQGGYAPYTLASDEPLTGEQTRAVCMAEPGLCFRLACGPRDEARRYMSGCWEWYQGGWRECTRFEQPFDTCSYTLVHDPEETQKAPETQGDRPCQTLPRTTKSLVEAAQHLEAGGVVESNSILYRVRDDKWQALCGKRWVPIERMVTRPELPIGRPFTLHPSDHMDKPKPKPKSGAELRRWMVAHPGRVVVFEHGYKLVWCECEAKFEHVVCGAQAVVAIYDTGTPETGTWDEDETP